jgi:hypothetical protein
LPWLLGGAFPDTLIVYFLEIGSRVFGALHFSAMVLSEVLSLLHFRS